MALIVDSPAGERLPYILTILGQTHPDARCALEYQTPFQLLVATILSAQCTDKMVNRVTPALFVRYPDPQSLAEAELGELTEAIHSITFYRQKASYLQKTARRLLQEHDGQVPDEPKALHQLPGVARKTANVVLGEIFGKAEGVVVDTHVKRLSQRLGLTKESRPEKIEKDLMNLVARENWIRLSHLLIFHGRRICHARKPACSACPVRQLCPAGTFIN